MIKLIWLALLLSSCGYSARHGKAVGQVKWVEPVTPMFCRDRNDVGITLGVMQNGTGSMSTHDVQFTILHDSDVTKLMQASAEGKIVEVIYSQRRFAICQWDMEVESVSVLK